MSTEIFKTNKVIHEEDLEEFLIANGYDVFDDPDDTENRVIDSCKVIEIAGEHGFGILDPDDDEKHSKGYIFEKLPTAKKEKLTKEDVWGVFDPNNDKLISNGMIVAKSYEVCPIFGDVLPYKSVTVICDEEQCEEVIHWLIYVHGGNCVSYRKELKDGKVAFRSNYMCW